MGKNKSALDPPQMKESDDSFASAINAEIASLPGRLSAEQTYRPQFANVDLATLESFAPRIAKLTAGLARKEQDLQRELNPEMFAAREGLAKRIALMGGGLDQPTEDYFRQQFAAEEGAAGRLGSPVGSASIARKLVMAKMMRDQQLASEALSMSGQLPTFGSSSVSLAQPSSQPTLTGGFVAPQLGLQSSLNSANANIYANRLNDLTTRRGQNMGLAGDSMGAGASVLAAIISDRRVKEQVKQVGRLDNGLPVYTFNYLGDPATHLGLMAQDVEKLIPEAVVEISGIKLVNYEKAVNHA